MLFTAPEPIDAFDFDGPPPRKSIFVAGGITGCDDWQSQIVAIIDRSEYDVYNPRRPSGLEKTGDEAEKQIAWEHAALMRADHVIFWFPETSICPITLFEYGVMLERARRGEVSVVMGRHPDYPRAFDLDFQTRLVVESSPAVADVPVAHSFDEFCAAVNLWFGPWDRYAGYLNSGPHN